MKCVYLEPFYSGSHQDVVDGWMRCSEHEIRLFSLPGEFWKWRMRTSAFDFIDRVVAPETYDVVWATSLVNFSDIKASWGKNCPRSVLYFHESQVSYPIPKGQAYNFQFPSIEFASAIAADYLLFNSNFHQQTFKNNLGVFVDQMPDPKPIWALSILDRKSSVLYPGCHFAHSVSERLGNIELPSQQQPLLLWNHRWEFDKCPEKFVTLIHRLNQSLAIPFEVAILGETSQMQPQAFNRARDELGPQIIQFGYVPNKDSYYQWLRRGTILVSCAIQENFGISVIEAMAYGCFPLLPNALVYPEILPDFAHPFCLYNGFEDLIKKCQWALENPQKRYQLACEIAASMSQYSWESQAVRFDSFLTQIG